MSIALMTQAWKLDMPLARKMVLIALCDSANDSGMCFPSVSMLAAKCSLTERSVQQQIAALQEAGILSREMRDGRSTIYQIAPPEQWSIASNPRTTFTPERRSPPNVVHPTPERRSPPPPNHVHPTPEPRSPITQREPSIEPKGNQNKGAREALPVWLDATTWDEFEEHRRSTAIRKPLTDLARRKCWATLDRLRADGHDPTRVLEQSIANGWTGVFPLKEVSSGARTTKQDARADFWRQMQGGEPIDATAERVD